MITSDIILFLVILVASIVFFSIEIVSIDIVALCVLVLLILTGLISPEQAFSGFGSDTFIFILGLLMITAALIRTGVVARLGRLITRYTGHDPNRLFMIITIGSAALSSFMSNTAATAFLLPVVTGIAQKAKISLSRFLLPLAFASIMTSAVTLISTSTNILVSGMMVQYGMHPMGMFELAPVGIPITIIGLAYMFTIGQRLIPDRAIPSELTEEFNLRPYLTEVLIRPNSFLVGKTLVESGLGRDLDLTVVRILRGDQDNLIPDPDNILMADDVLLVQGHRDEILKIKETAGIDIKAEVQLSDPDLQTEEMGLVEAILLPRSPVIGRTLKGVRFRERYGLQVLAVHRGEETLHAKISQIPLRMGDILLIQGHRANISLLQEDKTFHILGHLENKRPNYRRAPIAMAIAGGVLLLSVFEVLPLSVLMLVGAVLMLLTRCLTPEEAYRDVEWKALILIGCMLSLGVAMETTGTAQFLAAKVVEFGGHLHPIWLLSIFFVLAVLLTQPMSNQAAAAVILPIAIQTANQLSLNPRTFAMMVAVAASCSFLTPLEPSCVMVYGPGHYRFMDFFKVGSILTVLIYLIAIVLVPLVWPY